MFLTVFHATLAAPSSLIFFMSLISPPPTLPNLPIELILALACMPCLNLNAPCAIFAKKGVAPAPPAGAVPIPAKAAPKTNAASSAAKAPIIPKVIPEFIIVLFAQEATPSLDELPIAIALSIPLAPSRSEPVMSPENISP